MATVDQAIDALSETSKKYILKLAADRSEDTRSQLINLAKTSAHDLYTRDWIEETTWAIEADRDCYGDEVDQAQTEADETMRDIYTSIKFASPFLPAEYSMDSLVIVIQTLLNGKIYEGFYLDELMELADDILNRNKDLLNHKVWIEKLTAIDDAIEAAIKT